MNTKEKIETPPVAFMIFNRPDYAQNVFNEIRKARPKKLFVVADGPRTPEEAVICKETRAIIDQVDWDCEVYKNYAEKNMGLKERISSGLNWFFDNVEAGIILEDDCLPHPSFFPFVAEMLEHYKDDERIMMVSGDNFLTDFKSEDSYFFSRYFPIWGWATWRRAWKKYDITIPSWNKPQSKQMLKDMYPQKEYMVEHMTMIFDKAYQRTLRTWDVQWLYACIMSEGFCIMPQVNLISNIGLAGTHGSGDNQNLPVFNIFQNGPLRHPDSVIQKTDYDNAFYERNFWRPKQSIITRLRFKIIEIAVQYESLKKIYRFLLGKKK